MCTLFQQQRKKEVQRNEIMNFMKKKKPLKISSCCEEKSWSDAVIPFFFFFVSVPLKGTDNFSGAYLFLPDGPSSDIPMSNLHVVIDGPVVKKVMN